MRIAVVGAGVAGLGAARELKQAGLEVTVFEKSVGLGGRCATRRANGYIFDTGATSIAPRGMALEQTMLEHLSTEDLVEIERPIWVTQNGRAFPGDRFKNSMRRFCYRSGINKLGKLLGEGIDLRTEKKVELVSQAGERWSIEGEIFDKVILSQPAPQSLELLEKSGIKRGLSHVQYRKTLSVILGLEDDLNDRPYHALVEPEQRHPITWISMESIKSPGRAPAGCTSLVVQFNAAFSERTYEWSDAEIGQEALRFVRRFFELSSRPPAVMQVKRWRYAQPLQSTDFERVNPVGSTLFVIGDGVTGPRIEQAYESGVKVARLIIKE